MSTVKKKRFLLVFGVALALVSSIGSDINKLTNLANKRELIGRLAAELIHPTSDGSTVSKFKALKVE